MNARAVIAQLRERMSKGAGMLFEPEQIAMLADLAEEGLSSLRSLVESECVFVREGPQFNNFRQGWWDTSALIDGLGGEITLLAEARERATIDAAVALLDRAGEIERKPGEPHMVRFIEQEG